MQNADDGPGGPSRATRWSHYIEKMMDTLGWDNATLSRRSGVERSLIGRWRNDGTEPSIKNIRAVAAAFGVDLREALVEAELFTEGELRTRTITPDIRRISDEELANEVRRRMGAGRTYGGRVDALGVNSLPVAADAAETEEVLFDDAETPESSGVEDSAAVAVETEPKPKPRRRRVK